MQKLTKLFPLIAFVGILLGTQNWWRIELLLNPVDTASIKPTDVIMYSTQWCSYCRKARNFLSEAEVPFTEYDIEKSPRAYQQYRAISGRGVPVFQIGNQTIQGFDKAAIRSALTTLKQTRDDHP